MMSIYISDIGIACALGNGKQAVTKALFSTKASSIKNERPLLSEKKVPIGSLPFELPELDEELKSLNSRNNRLIKLGLDEIRGSVEQAIEKYGRSRIGVVMATSTSGMYEEEKAFIYKHQAGHVPEGYYNEQAETSSPSMFVSKYFGLEGPSYTVSTACSSSGKAFCSARRLITAGICDVVITGGADTLCDLTLNGFDSLELMSTKICNPFSKNRDGITIGEGAAVFLVTGECPQSNPVELAGYGESSDAYHISCPEPTGTGAEVAIKAALHMAGLKPEDICYINLHGTGTSLNDSMESISINRIFGENLPCGSTKALTGHALGASGALEAAFLWLALSLEENGQIPLPPHIWDGQTDSELPPIRFSKLDEKATPINGSYALMSNSFAFGGSNVSIILTKKTQGHVPIKDLLPHDPPMVLLDRVISFTNEYIHTQVTIHDQSPFCENGLVPSYVAIEYMAQAIGVWNGMISRCQNQSPKIGFLLGTRCLDLDIPNFKVGDTLDVCGRAQYIDGEMASFDCWINIQEKRAAHASLNVYQPKDVNMLLGENSVNSK